MAPIVIHCIIPTPCHNACTILDTINDGLPIEGLIHSSGSGRYMGSRGSGFRRTHKKSLDREKTDDCSNCYKPYYQIITNSIRSTIKDKIRDDWNEEAMPSIPGTTCRCYDFVLNDSEMSDWKDELLKSAINVEISKCNKRTRIQLISNGKEVHRMYLRRLRNESGGSQRAADSQKSDNIDS